MNVAAKTFAHAILVIALYIIVSVVMATEPTLGGAALCLAFAALMRTYEDD